MYTAQLLCLKKIETLKYLKFENKKIIENVLSCIINDGYIIISFPLLVKLPITICFFTAKESY